MIMTYQEKDQTDHFRHAADECMSVRKNAKKQGEAMKNRMISHTFRQSLYVLVLSSMVTMLGALVDGIIIGRLMGSAVMAAYGIALPATVLIAGIANVVSSGSQSLSSKALARGEKDTADAYLSSAVTGSLIFGAALGALMILLREPLCILMGAEAGKAKLLSDAASYLAGYAPAVPAILLTQTLSSYMHLENARKRAFAAALIGTVVNCAGDLVNTLFVHGGMVGMGLTTAISYYVMTAILLQQYRRPEHVLTISPQKSRLHLIGEFTVLGLPSADIQVCSTVRTVLLNRLLLTISTQIAVSAFSVRMSMYNLYGSVVIGFGLATLLVTSFYIGEENESSVREVLTAALRGGIFTMVVLSALVCIFTGPLVRMFAGDTEVFSMAVDSVRFFALSLPIFVVNSILSKYYQALGRHVLSHVMTILENLIYVCLLAFLLGRSFNVTGVWVSFIGTELLTLLTLLLIVWGKNGRFPRSIDDFMLLPADFGPRPEEQLQAECENRLQVEETMVRIWSFLKVRGADQKSASQVALCAEELMKNAVEQVERRGDGRHVQIRLMDKKKEWALCLRDDGKSFDPMRWLRDHEEEKERYGLRLVRLAADDIQHVYTLNMNQILIRIKKEETNGTDLQT